MMTREDLLRELELLPIWQLHKPVSGDVSVAAASSAANTESEADTNALVTLQQSFRLISSADDEWLFLLSPASDKESEELLQNILKAIGVSIHQDIIMTEDMDLNALNAKVIVVMGESEAQKLLNDEQSLSQLRGRAHMLKDKPAVVTYSLQHLLENLSDKAMAWEDLCLAKLTIAYL
jgi:DNA polymerase